MMQVAIHGAGGRMCISTLCAHVLWCGPGQLAESNAQQVRKMRQVLEGLSLEVATPADAREMLALKGGDNVNF